MKEILIQLSQLTINVETYLSFVLGFISTSYFYFRTEKKKRKQEIKLYLSILHKDSKLFIQKIQLVKRSVEMFHSALDDFKNQKIGSIGFPNYSIKELSTDFPLSVLDYDVDDFIEKIDATNSNISSFNGFISDFFVDVTEIQDGLKQGTMSVSTAIKRYEHRENYLKKYMSNMDIFEKSAIDVNVLILFFLKRTKHRSFRLSIYHLKMDPIEHIFYKKFNKKESNKLELRIEKIKENIISEI